MPLLALPGLDAVKVVLEVGFARDHYIVRLPVLAIGSVVGVPLMLPPTIGTLQQTHSQTYLGFLLRVLQSFKFLQFLQMRNVHCTRLGCIYFA